MSILNRYNIGKVLFIDIRYNGLNGHNNYKYSCMIPKNKMKNNYLKYQEIEEFFSIYIAPNYVHWNLDKL